MQVLLHTDPHVDGRQQMADHLDQVISAALGRFGERISRVEGYLTDADGEAKGGVGTIHCTLEAHLTSLGQVVVKEHADNAHQAIEGAARKLKRAVGAEIGKHDPRRQRGQHEVVVSIEDAAPSP